MAEISLHHPRRTRSTGGEIKVSVNTFLLYKPIRFGFYMKHEKNKHAVALGKIGGSKTSEAKRAAVRRNGLLGGRPKKILVASNHKNKRRVLAVENPREIPT